MGKRLFAALLAVLMLAGCATEKPQNTKEPTTTGRVQPEPGLYQAGSEMEKATQGAVRGYQLPGELVDLTALGNDLVAQVSAGDGNIQLVLLSGENCAVKGQLPLAERVDLQPSHGGLCYYSAEEQCVVALDSALQETSRISLPPECREAPLVSGDLAKLYYCTDTEIFVMDLRSGVSRMLKQQNSQEQTLRQLIFEETLLVADTVEDGAEFTCFISTETGQTVQKTERLALFLTDGPRYFLQRQEGICTEFLFGKNAEDVRALTADVLGCGVHFAGNGRYILAAAPSGKLRLFDLDSGVVASVLENPALEGACGFLSHGGYIWCGAGAWLYRWDHTAGKTENPESCVGPRYTAEAPDTAGLETCREKARELSERYGVSIVFLSEDVHPPKDYTFALEHQVPALMAGLAALEQGLAQFPEGSLQKMVEDTAGKRLEICLVRSISGNTDGLQYWLDANAYIALSIGPGTQQCLYHQLCHVLDAFIYANSRDLDVWDKLNPQGFAYDRNYTAYLTHDETYLAGEDRAFIDAYSRSYPKEDRARILEYALTPGCEELFQSETMQKKLRLLCFAIRDAYGWKKDSRVFPWEQYLQEPLAYSK